MANRLPVELGKGPFLPGVVEALKAPEAVVALNQPPVVEAVFLHPMMGQKYSEQAEGQIRL